MATVTQTPTTESTQKPTTHTSIQPGPFRNEPLTDFSKPENRAAMAKMMAGMQIQPTGDVDADFVAMMTPHHQGAIDMARAELRYCKNEQLRRIARQIIVQQQQEIPAMRHALGHPLPPSTPAPDQTPRSPK